MNKEELAKLYDLVYNYKTKYKEGFINVEQEELIKLYPGIDMKKYDNAMMGNTCMMSEDGNGFIMYHCDVYKALQCGIEGRELTVEEWD